MKTEPTINIQSEVAKIHSQFGMTEIANYRIEKLFEMYVKQSSPKIKQLEWIPVSSNGKDCLIAWTSLCIAYEIDSSVNPIILFNLDCIPEPFDTIDEAKSAAQRDFEKRVKECLG